MWCTKGIVFAYLYKISMPQIMGVIMGVSIVKHLIQQLIWLVQHVRCKCICCTTLSVDLWHFFSTVTVHLPCNIWSSLFHSPS